MATKTKNVTETSKDTQGATVNVETKKPIDPMEDRVKMTIVPPTQDKDGATEYISCNTYNATAKYGEEMKVPRFVSAIIENQKMALNELKKTLAKQSK